jgi:protein disulfide-isomerase
MKKIVFLFLIGIITTSINAQELTWHTDMNKAIAISKKENKPLFLFFTGSDWCGWCIKLQKEVFKTPEFTAWAKEKAVLVELDFPRRSQLPEALKNQNNQLQQLFRVQGFPTVWFSKEGIGTDGKTGLEQIGSTGYVAGGPTAWIAVADQIVAKFVPDKKVKKAKKKKVKS